MTDEEQSGVAPGSSMGAQPVVPWEQTASQPDAITTGRVLRDAFARYGADPVRIFLVGLIPSIIAVVGARSQGVALLVGILNLFAISIVLVLADRGPSLPLGEASGRGARRVVALFLTTLVIGLFVFALVVIPVILILIYVGANAGSGLASNIGLALIVLALLAIPLAWVITRLYLAVPAAVIDELGVNASLARSRAATKKPSTVISLFAALFVAGIAALPGSLAAGGLSVLAGVPIILIDLVGGLAAALVAPLAALVALSAYRIAYPPVAPAPATPAAPEVIAEAPASDAMDTAATTLPAPAATAAAATAPAATAPADPAPPQAAAPAFGSRARALVALVTVVAIGGLATFALTIGAVASGAVYAGGVERGKVVFGTSSDLNTCTVQGEFTETGTDGQVAWVAAFAHRTVATDRIHLVVNFNGQPAGDTPQPAGAYDCLGSQEPETGLTAGQYELVLYVNDQVSARGGFTVH